MSMREGKGVATTPVSPALAFAFLADPRNAPEWFAPVTFAPTEPGDATPASAPVASSASMTHVGAIWRFVPNPRVRRTRSTPWRRAAIPVRMVVYEPSTRFVWETTYPPTRDNLRWEITCASTTQAPDVVGATSAASAIDATHVTTPTLSAAPTAGRGTPGDGPLTHSSPSTALHMSLRIQPGPLGWVLLLLAAPFTRGGLDRRAQRALDRARETLVARAELAPPPRPPRNAAQRGEKRKRRR